MLLKFLAPAPKRRKAKKAACLFHESTVTDKHECSLLSAGQCSRKCFASPPVCICASMKLPGAYKLCGILGRLRQAHLARQGGPQQSVRGL